MATYVYFFYIGIWDLNSWSFLSFQNEKHFYVAMSKC
jgi:hypothetical protein